MANGKQGEDVRVLIADDQAVFRRGLRAVLAEEPGIEVVAEASDGDETLAKVEELAPDVVLLDVRMPKRSGLDVARALQAVAPTTRILMVTVSDEEEDLFEAVRAGASGYLLKEISVEEVADAIRQVAQGQSLISPLMASKLMAEFNALAERAEARFPAPTLTSRELEVLSLAAKGLSNRDIAERLFIAENTVKNHIRNILEKLHLHSRMEAVMYAVREHLIDTDGR
jgi:two-component system NarL family response regulator